MAHFAKLIDNVVVEVLVVNNDVATDEQAGVDFLVSTFGPAEWLQCSFNGNIRKQHPGVGFTYDPEADVFVSPCPGPGWTLDENHEWFNPDAISILDNPKE